MQVQGHVQNGLAVPDGAVALPEGAEVLIVVTSRPVAASETMSAEELSRYRDALAGLKAVPNENPGDSFSGADHDQELYGACE